jgi:hypothetical protein
LPDRLVGALKAAKAVADVTVQPHRLTCRADTATPQVAELSSTTHTSPRDVRVRLAELVNDLTNESGFEHFRTVTVAQAVA